MISPLGKTPLLRIDGRDVIFESAVICEYLDETQQSRLHPPDPLARAHHRSWIEFASATLNDIAGLYNAPDATTFERKREDLKAKAAQFEGVLGEGPYFAGPEFGLVDAAFAPVFRYFDAFEKVVDLGTFTATPKTRAWRQVLELRPSVMAAVDSGYAARLTTFLAARPSYLGRQMGIGEKPS